MRLLEEMALQQSDKLLKLARRFVPHATTDDILQPQDFPELEQNPEFRYEEGVLAGIRAAEIALKAYEKSHLN